MIEAEVVLGKFKDAVERKIPIRTEGILSKRFIFHHGQKGKEKFIFEDLAKKGKLKVSLSRFPKSVLSEPIHYLLDFSPLASSDSIIRTAQTSLEVKRLTEKGLLTGEYYQEGKIKLFNGERKSVGSLLENSLSELGRRQSRNGSISNYPVREMYYENAENDPRTEIALLGLLQSMEAEGFRQLISSHFKGKLEKYLNTLGNDTPELYLYMLAQRKTNKKLNLTLVRQLAKQYPKNIAVQTLSFYLLARENTPNTLRKSAEQLGILFDQAFLQGQYFEELLIDLKALQGYYLKGLIAQSQYKSNAQSFFSEELNKQLLSLLKSRRNDGLRSRSSTTNFLILDALNQALELYYSAPVRFKQGEKTMECEIQFGTGKHKLLDTTKQQLILPFTQRKELELERSCNQAGFIDLQAEYLLQDLNKKENELHHLEYFSLSLPKEIEKDKKVTFKGSFKPQKESKNLIVEFNIPSQFKLLANQAPRDHHDQLFELIDDWECFPDHHEFRFDRVILEYKHLKAGQNCSFEFDALPNFEGKSVLPPSKLYEQDRTEVWGSSKLTIIE